jgi:ABC-type nitrate/sulfonate/bicarbonate transport system permease component
VSDNNGSGPDAQPTAVQRAVVVGYILAVAVPPVGFLIGLVLLLSPRVRSKHGTWMVLLSIVAAVVWVLLIDAGALKNTSQGY